MLHMSLKFKYNHTIITTCFIKSEFAISIKKYIVNSGLETCVLKVSEVLWKLNDNIVVRYFVNAAPIFGENIVFRGIVISTTSIMV